MRQLRRPTSARATRTGPRATRDADSRPSTHYGVYKQANEGNARIYWQDERVPSLGLRPYNVYGPARDQGITAEPTHAMAAAAGGEGYHIDYGGRLTFNHAADVARAFIAMSRSAYEGSAVFNMPGPVAHMSRGGRPRSRPRHPRSPAGSPSTTVQLPLPAEMATGGLAEAIGPVRVTPLADAVRETVEHFRRQVSVMLVLRSAEPARPARPAARRRAARSGRPRDRSPAARPSTIRVRRAARRRPRRGGLDGRYRGGWQLAAPNAGSPCVVGDAARLPRPRLQRPLDGRAAASDSSCVLTWSGPRRAVERGCEADGQHVDRSVDIVGVAERAPLVAARAHRARD